MKSKKYFILLLLLCLYFTSQAQRNCGAMEHLELQLQQNPKLLNRMQNIEKATQKFIQNQEKVVTGVINIPVVVHVVYNNSSENLSASQIATQIAVLNEDFRRLNSDANNDWPQAADSEIEFCLATVNPQGNTTTGITRTSTSVTSFSTNDNVKFNSSGGRNAWPSQNYLNIWVCDLSGGLLGYAQFPGGPSSTDGVVVDYQYFGTNGTATPPFDLGRTTTHEVGHWLNLRHIWGDGPCSIDDFVSDTPKSDNPNYGCPLNHTSCGNLDMVANYMDYTDDSCMNLYTLGQKSRMRALFEPGGFRASLLNSPACGNSTPPTCTDGVQNGDETGIDCGGSTCPPCASCAGTEVMLTIVLDDYPEETSWELTDDSNNTIASGGTYGNLPNGSTVTETICLSDGCYDFTINDTYGDGICCAYGNGSYLLEDDSSNTLASGGSFAYSETTNFCLGSTPPPTCNDGIQNGDETGIDCGGSTCPPCSSACTNQLIDLSNFDSTGWGIWIDGGSDSRISIHDTNFSYSNPRCVRLRDNTNSSVITTQNLDLGNYEEVTIDFTFITKSFENGEDFWLQVSTNGGSTWQTLVAWVRGSDFNNNVREFETVIITGNFTTNTKFRFRCDAGDNGDRVYIDDVEINGCINSSTREIDESHINHQSEIIVDYDLTSEFISDIMLYPNPSVFESTLSFNSDIEQSLKINIYNGQGQVMKSIQNNSKLGINRIRLNTLELPEGLYFVELQTGAEKMIRKLLIIK